MRHGRLRPRPVSLAGQVSWFADVTGGCQGRVRAVHGGSFRVFLAYGARAERGLTTRTPERIPSGQLPGAHLGPTHQAGLTGATVDVDLAPVVVHTRRPAHRLGSVLGPHGVDATGQDSLVHQV